MKKFIYSSQIKEFHLDTFGHVNHAAYLNIFEDARWDMLDAGGYGLERIKETQKGPVILDIKVRYMKELKNREKFKIESYATKIAGKIFIFQQDLIKESGDISATAEMTIGYFDMVNRKLITLDPEWVRVIGSE